MIKSKTLPLAVLGMLALSGCATDTVDISSYAPVIDIYQHDIDQYNTDLSQCRILAVQAQNKYQEQRKKEQSDMMASMLVGAVIGAAIGNSIDSNDDSGTTIGAIYGAGVGASVQAESNGYDRLMVKFGPTAVVDRCMINRGYSILSTEGMGGG
jgi:uncharacterized protein YcfJ